MALVGIAKTINDFDRIHLQLAFFQTEAHIL